MIDVGTVAGKVWEELNRSEGLSITALVKVTGEKKDTVLMALGWLLREDKLSIGKKGAAVLFSLK